MKKIVLGQDDRVGDFVGKGIGIEGQFHSFSSIGLEENGELVAGIVYSDFNGNNLSASIHGLNRTWMNREFLWVIFHYPFEQAKVKRITAVVEESNSLSHNLVKRLGFTHEATLQQAGRSGDLHIYRMFRDECKWLEVFHGRYGK